MSTLIVLIILKGGVFEPLEPPFPGYGYVHVYCLKRTHLWTTWTRVQPFTLIPFLIRSTSNGCNIKIAKIHWRNQKSSPKPLIKINQRTSFKSHITWPPIPWSVNSFLQYKSSTFGIVQHNWYILHSFKGQRRFMPWALKNNWLILRPYNSDFLLKTTSFIPSWIIMNEMGVSSHKGRYSGHFLVNISRDN